MKYIFIINAIAGRGKYKEILPNIKSVCKKRNIEYEIKYVTSEIGGEQIAREYKDEQNIIYVVGGDGTLTKTIPGIVGTKNKLGIIPSGSGNDTYKATKKLPQGDSSLDLGKINNTYFINVACTGLDAEVANNLDKLKSTIIPTKYLYKASIVYTFFNFKFRKAIFKTDIKNIASKYSTISICNGAFYGGGFNIAPKSELTDGLLDVYYIEKMNKIKMMKLLLKLKNGKHEGKRKVHKFRTNHIEIEIEKEITFNVDGEKLTDKKFIIDIIPKAITLYNDREFVESILKSKVNIKKSPVYN